MALGVEVDSAGAASLREEGVPVMGMDVCGRSADDPFERQDASKMIPRVQGRMARFMRGAGRIIPIRFLSKP
jgi:hypothetical protein